jgi:MFS family permease
VPGSRISSPQYRWYVAAQCVSLVGTSMSTAALYWLAIQVAHGNALLLSVVVAAQFIPFLVFSRRAGTIVAKRRPARLLIVTQALQLVASLAFAVPLFAGWMSPWYLCPLALALGFILAVDVPTRQMLMLDLVGRDELRRGSSLYNTFVGLSKILGPSLAGAIMAATGEGLVFAIDSASFILVICVLLRFSGDIVHVTGAGHESRLTARRFRWVLDLPGRIQAIAFLALLLGGFAYQFEVTNPLMATRVFHLGAAGYGLMGTFVAAGGIAGSYYSSRRPDPGMYEVLVWSGLFGAAEAIAAVMGSAWGYDVLMVVIGAATQLFVASSTVYIQHHAPEEQRAHALSAYNSGFLGFVPAGAFVVAAIAASAGVRWALIGPGLVLVAFVIVAAARLSLPRTPSVAHAPPASPADSAPAP